MPIADRERPARKPGFEIHKLAVLGYSQGFTLWHYRAPEIPLGTVAAEGFMQDATELLAQGDMVLVSAVDGGRVLYVTKQGHRVGTEALV